jgi:hypothetical protein
MDSIIDKFMQKSLEKKLGGSLPDFMEMMKGYTFENGVLKQQVEYSLSEGELDQQKGFIMLYADADYTASSACINATLTIKIVAPTMAFIYIPFTSIKPLSEFNILLPNQEEKLCFLVISSVFSTNIRTEEIKKGTPIGYGFFIPINPINTIDFINQNAT